MRTNADIAGYKPDVSGTINLNNGSTISLSTSDFVSNSLTIRTSTSTGEFSIGSVAIGGISFVLLNDTGKFNGIDWYDSTVDLTLTVNETQIQLGRHWIANHNETGWMISVECHDVTHVLDKFNVGNLGLSFPCTVQDVLTAFASFYAEQDHNYGITFDTTSISSMLSVSIPEIHGEMTQRAFLSYIAQICGSFVRTHGTTLKFAWYDMSNKYSAGTTFSHSLRTNDVQFKLVKVVDTDGGIEIQRVGTNTSGETITIEDNPLITPDNLSAICSRLSAALDGLVYRPGDITIKSHAGVEAGDVLLVSTGQEQNITVLAMNVTYKLQLTEQVSADVSQYEGDLRKNAAGYARQIANDTVDEALANIGNVTRDIVSIDVVQTYIDDRQARDPDIGKVDSVQASIFPFGTGTMKELTETFSTVGAASDEEYEEIQMKRMLRFPSQIIHVRTYQSCLADSQRIDGAAGSVTQIKFPVSMMFDIYSPRNNDCGKFRDVRYGFWNEDYMRIKCEIMCYYKDEKTIELFRSFPTTICVPGWTTKNGYYGNAIVYLDVNGPGGFDGFLKYIDSSYENDDMMHQFVGKWMYVFDWRYLNW